MSWNYEEMYSELLKVDDGLVKEDIISELKRIEANNSKPVVLLKGQELWNTLKNDFGFIVPLHFITGTNLADYCKLASEFKRRDAYYKLEHYCNMNTHSKIGVLFGLRSTGKTIVMQQLAGRGQYIHESAYTTLRYRQCKVWELEKNIKKLQAAGIKYVFIDEICYAEDFVEYCAGIADNFPSMKIIVSGTDSLSLYLAENKTWFHRTETVSTTWMSYPEYNRVIGGDILSYLKHGGVFEYTGYNLENYISTSVVDNIYNTVMNVHEASIGGETIKALSKQEFYNIVYAISISVTINKITSKAAEMWGKKFAHGLNKALRANKLTLIPKAMESIISNAYPYQINSSVYDKEVVQTVIMYLKHIDYLTEVPLMGDDGERKLSLIFTQMRILRDFTNNVVNSVLETSELTSAERAAVVTSLGNHSDGEILEPVVLLALRRTDQAKALGTFIEKFRAIDGSYEIDVIVDIAGKPLTLIEVKLRQTIGRPLKTHL